MVKIIKCISLNSKACTDTEFMFSKLTKRIVTMKFLVVLEPRRQLNEGTSRQWLHICHLRKIIWFIGGDRLG